MTNLNLDLDIYQLVQEIESDRIYPSEQSFNLINIIASKVSDKYKTPGLKGKLKSAHKYGSQFELLTKWTQLKIIFKKKYGLDSVVDNPSEFIELLLVLSESAARRNFKFLQKRKNFYLDPKALFVEVLKSKRSEKLNTKTLNMFLKLAFEVVDRMPYSDTFLKEEAESGARIDLLLYWNRFNEQKSINCFAYMTQIAKMGSAKSFNKSYKYGKKFKGKLLSINGSAYNTDSDGIYSI